MSKKKRGKQRSGRGITNTFAVEIILAVILAALGIVFTNSTKLSDSERFMVGTVLFIAQLFAIDILNGRRQLQAHTSHAVIRRDRTTAVIRRFLEDQRTSLNLLIDSLQTLKDVELERRDMYHVLRALAVSASHERRPSISAISGINVEEFGRDLAAQAYLETNEELVAAGVSVRRLFLVGEDQLDDPLIREVLERHAKALTAPPKKSRIRRKQTAGVKWLYKHLAGEDRDQDFALFCDGAIVQQTLGGRKFELSGLDGKIRPAEEVFERLWNHPDARSVDQLPLVSDSVV